MNFLSILVCLSLAVLVSSEVLSSKYQKKFFQKAEEAERTASTQHFRSQYNYVDNTSDCCRNSNNNCRWAVRRVSGGNSMRYGYYMRYRGSFFYRPASSIVFCGCVGAELCPTTTAAAPTTTTTATPTTTTTATITTTTVTTTTATTRFCPAEASTTTSTTRLVNGINISGCSEFAGLVAIQTAAGTVCTGVITSGTTLSIPSNCATSVFNADIVAPNGILIASGVTATPNGVGGPVQVTLPTAVASDSCPGIACVYSSTMANDILLDTCKVAAAGYSDNAATSTPAFEYLDIPALQPTDNCQALLEGTATSFLFNFANSAITYNCFISHTGSSCIGVGGQIQCDLTTGEKVVIGQIENGDCTAAAVGFYNLETSSVRVLPTSKA